MAVLVSLDKVSTAQGTRTLLDEVSLGVGDGERIGVLGPNGAGKTTLLRILARELEPDSGRVTHATGTRVGVLTQADDLDPAASVLELVVGRGVAEHTWRGDAHVRAVLAGIGVDPLLERTAGELSGGERRRVTLARLLIADLDLLMLDEPTNHLDVEGVAWLAAHLASGGRHRALLVVTHDRWFLDEVASAVWEVADGNVHAYEGGYSAYALARAERARQAEASESKRQNLLRKEVAWLRRGAPARTSKPRYRVEAANALIADEPPPRDTVGLQRFAATRLGKSVYDVEDAFLSYGTRVILDDVTWRLGPGERIGLVGVNGAGKTSLLHVLTGEQGLDAGGVRTGVTVKVGVLAQDPVGLPKGTRVLEAAEEIARVMRVGREDLTASQLLERFGFPAARQWTPVADLSGGERRRLELLRILLAEPNVLLLDEPTNDLDLDTLIALEDVLDNWAGTLVTVSHDRWFLDRVCDSVVALMGDGSLAALPGGVEEYLRRRRDAGAGPGSTPAAAKNGPVARSATGGYDPRADRKELQRLEKSVQRLLRQESALHAELAESATDHTRVLDLDARLRAVVAERAAAEDSWLEISERIEDGAA